MISAKYQKSARPEVEPAATGLYLARAGSWQRRSRRTMIAGVALGNVRHLIHADAANQADAAARERMTVRG
jgi:hypothetical protein